MEKIALVKCVMSAAKAVGIAQMANVNFRKEEINLLEKLRAELHEFIAKYGFGDARTIRKSEELDIEVNKEMRNAILDIKAAECNFNEVDVRFIDVAIYNYNSAKSKLEALIRR